MTQKTIIIVLIFMSLLLAITGCTNQNEEIINPPVSNVEDEYSTNTENTEPKESIPNSDNSLNEDHQNNETDNQQKITVEEEQKPAYYVNKNNYLIKPVNPDDDKKVVLLTFDDAPQGKVTMDILDILDKYDAKAIFFINGHYAVKDKELLKEIYNRGHIIGNHTWWHENLKKITIEKTKSEIIDVDDFVEEALGIRPIYFRPPFGVMSDTAKEIITAEGMQSMNWSLGSLDWEYTKPEQAPLVVEQVVNNIHAGANILMHDKEVTSLALEQILATLQEKGYSFVLPTEVILSDK